MHSETTIISTDQPGMNSEQPLMWPQGHMMRSDSLPDNQTDNQHMMQQESQHMMSSEPQGMMPPPQQGIMPQGGQPMMTSDSHQMMGNQNQ